VPAFSKNRYRQYKFTDSRKWAPVKAQRIVYLYRDAGNYKFRGEFLLVGDFKLADIANSLIDGEYFIPRKIGLPDLLPEIRNDEDHMLHEFESIEAVETRAPAFVAQDFAARVRAANNAGWF